MPTFIPNTNAVVTLDNTSGTPTDVSTTVSKIDLDAKSTVGSFFTFGSASAYKTEGKRTYTGSMGIRSAEDSSGADYIVSAWFHPGGNNTMGTKTLQADTPDSTAGSYRYSGEIRAVDYKVVQQDAGGDGTATEKTLNFEWDSEPTRTIVT